MMFVFAEGRRNAIGVNDEAVIRRHEHNIYIRVEKQKGRVKIISGIVATIALRITFKRINAQRNAMSEEEVRAKYTDVELLEMGDKSPFFRYTL
jgi:AAA+ superfamily predicted ATPase